MNVRCSAANSAWLLSSLPDAIAFRRGLKRVPQAQRDVLLAILWRNARTVFGRQHGFASIRTIREFQERVPVRTYDEFGPYLQRIEAGAPRVLTASNVDHFEPTSGSSGATKLIPYTAELRSEFSRAIAPWIVGFASDTPRAFAGRSYWSLSPVTSEERRTAGGIRIGFDTDDEYLGSFRSALVRAVQAVPSSVRLQSGVDAFRHATLVRLLLARSLSLISVWHPGFLTLLVAGLRERGERLVRDIADIDRRRAEEMRLAFASSSNAATLHRALWPQLRAISCWADAGCATAAAEVTSLFPQARIAPKGLLSTEGIVSIPFEGSHALAYRSHFYELQSVSTGAILPAYEGEAGKRYAVIITTGGGLYRYATQDLVDVIGFRGSCPLLRFAGRANHVSDHFGEKLNEIFVRERLDSVLRELDVNARFAMLACEKDSSHGRYVLFIESDASDEVLTAITHRIDERLRESFHYDYCRQLGQLLVVSFFRIPRDASATHLTAAANTQPLGHIKPSALDKRAGWRERFETR